MSLRLLHDPSFNEFVDNIKKERKEICESIAVNTPKNGEDLNAFGLRISFAQGQAHGLKKILDKVDSMRRENDE